jgi:hypothetical protein
MDHLHKGAVSGVKSGTKLRSGQLGPARCTEFGSVIARLGVVLGRRLGVVLGRRLGVVLGRRRASCPASSDISKSATKSV